MTTTPSHRKKKRRFRRPLLVIAAITLAPPALYAAFVLIGSLPVNRGFVESPGGVAVYVSSDAVHTDLIVPIRHDAWDWSEVIDPSHFAGDTDWATHYAIGWGDRGFYLQTPTWSDLKASVAVNALLIPSGTVIHVQAYNDPAGVEGYRRVRISPEQYQRLCESIRESFEKRDESPEPIAGEAYHLYDAFYPARGRYYATYTCNSWAGDQLEAAGVCVPMWTPLPGSTTWYFPDETK